MGRPFTGLPTSLLMLLLLPHVLTAISALNDVNQCPLNWSKPAPDDARLVDGFLLAGNPQRKYSPKAYRQDQRGEYHLCTCITGSPCVRKCCKPNAAYGDSMKCNGSPPVTSFEVPKFVNASGTSDVHTEGQFQLVYGTLICKAGKYAMKPFEDNNNSFQVNHTGWLLDESEGIIAAPNQFCVEKFSKSNYQMLAIVCSPFSSQPEKNLVSKKLTTIGMILSLPFLFTTFLVYALIKDLQNLQGKSLMCNVSTLLVGYVCLITVQFVTCKNDLCIVLAYTTQFSFMASFFWLNVMCIDLWWTFSGIRNMIYKINSQQHGSKRFINYSIYAWGCTSLISIFTFSMDTLLTSSAMHPGFGEKTCWFVSTEALLLYFYGPIAITLFSNILMCTHTGIIIIKHTREINKTFKGSESRRNVENQKERFMMHMQLFVVMGVNWLAEIISGAFELEMIVTDIGNSLQGVLIFLFFVCKRRVLKLIIRKLCPQSQLFNSSNIVSTKTTNSTFSRIKSTIENTEKIEMSTDNI